MDDIRLVSVDVLAQSEISDREKPWWPGNKAPPLVRVRLSSSRDFQKLAKDWSYNVDNKTSICQGASIDPKRLIQGYPSVYDKFGMIYTYHEDHPDSATGGGNRIAYSVYFDPEDLTNTSFPYHYDLVADPANVCVQIDGLQEVGGDFTFASFRSNVVVVPKTAIIAAIKREGASQCPVQVVMHMDDTVTFNGVLYPMHTDAQRRVIQRELELRLRANRTCQIHLAGDPGISFKMAEQLILIGQQAGVSKIGILVEPRDN
ncbi:MAG TPA: hypothetical protein VJ476_02075 [Rhizomicrobium sp.]|nr:hypothetical protein [Rhizomicrobium sp.]